MDAHKTGPKGLKRPRLTPLDRLQIEAGLQNGESPYSIARRIGHDLKIVLREIRDRARTIKTGVACRLSNKCVHRADCRKKHVCPKCLHKRERLCMFCNQCNSHCADYREDVCAEAQKDYERLLSESRKGVNLTEEEVAKFDQLLHDLVKKGQSVHAVMVNNASLFTFCEKSAYRYVLPKATPYTEDASFDDLTQEDVNLLMSHINSYPRKALKDKTPYDLFTARVGEDVTEKVFGIRKVSPNDVVLKPSLLGTEVKIKEWVLREDSGR